MKYFLFTPNLLFLTFTFIFVVQCEELNPNWLRNPELESKWKLAGVGGYYSEGQGFQVQPGVSFQNNNEDMVVVSDVTSLIMICSAHYPVYWTYDLPDVKGRSVPSGHLHRISEDFQDPQTYKFYAYITLLGKYSSGSKTGTYTCISASDDTRKTTRFIFFEDVRRDPSTSTLCRQIMVHGEGVKNSSIPYSYSTPSTTPYCTSSGNECTSPACQDLPSTTVRADPNNQTITLPCAVNSPDTTLQLYKKSKGSNVTASSSYEAVDLTNTTGITFDPKVGFVLQVKEQVTPPYGIYKCTSIPTSTYERTSEFVIVNVIEGIEVERKGEIDRLSGNAKYFYDTSSHPKYGHRIECCSSGTKPPKIYTRMCKTKYECKTVRKQLGEFQHLDDSDIRKGNCRSSVVRSIYVSDSYSPVIGVFRCSGYGIDVTREFYIPPSTQNQSDAIYYDGDISGMNMSGLITFSSQTSGTEIGNELIAYNTNTSLTLTCHPLTYLFALGVRWSILYQNNTIELIPEDGPYVIGDSIETELENELTVKRAKDILSVTCHAPLSDSLQWVNETLLFNIKDTEGPKIEGPDVEKVSWLIGDRKKELVCEGTGAPTPTFTWTEPMSIYQYGDRSTGYRPYANWTEYYSYRETVRVNGESTLRFTRILPTMGGNYTCTAFSPLGAGTAVKTFIVTLTDKATDATSDHQNPIVSSASSTTVGTTMRSNEENTNTPAPPLIQSPHQLEPVSTDRGLGTGLVILLCLIGLIGVAITGGFIWKKMKTQRDVLVEEESGDSVL